MGNLEINFTIFFLIFLIFLIFFFFFFFFFFSYLIREEGRYVTVKFKGSETVYVDNIKLCYPDSESSTLTKVCITYRIPVI